MSRTTLNKSPEEMLKDLARLRDELGRDPCVDDFRKRSDIASLSAYRRVFGSLQKALGKLSWSSSVDSSETRRNILLDALLEEVDKKGQMLSKSEIENNPKLATYDEYTKYFGDFQYIARCVAFFRPGIKIKERKSRAKPNPNYAARGWRRAYTDEDLLNAVRRKAAELGYFPSAREVNRDKKMPTAMTIVTRFKCKWIEVKELTGLDNISSAAAMRKEKEEQYRARCKTEAVIQLQDLYHRLGRVPSSRDIDRDSFTRSSGHYANLYGSLEAARRAAGLPAGRDRGRSKQPPAGP